MGSLHLYYLSSLTSLKAQVESKGMPATCDKQQSSGNFQQLIAKEDKCASKQVEPDFACCVPMHLLAPAATICMPWQIEERDPPGLPCFTGERP